MHQMTVQELKSRFDAGSAPVILDVREPWEYELCAIPDSRHIPMNTIPARLADLDPDNEIVVVCHHGARSQMVAQYLERQGFKHLHNLAGGVAAWAQHIDPSMRQY